MHEEEIPLENDLATFAGLIQLLTAVAFIVGYIPAWRAANSGVRKAT